MAQESGAVVVAEAKAAGRRSFWPLVVLVLLMLAGLPLAVWLDISNLSRNALQRQAQDLSSVISSIRGYYAQNVVARVLNARRSHVNTACRNRNHHNA